MRILFLDHYGVMCLATPGFTRSWNSGPTVDELLGRRLFEPFNPAAVAVLNDILLQTNAEIIVSSDWKCRSTVDDMGLFYLQQGIIKPPLDFTSWLPGYSTYHEQRATEINYWLDHHNFSTWAAVDDLHMGITVNNLVRSWGLENFVWTEDIQAGITNPTVIHDILRYLKD